MSTNYRFKDNKTKKEVVSAIEKLGLEITKTEHDKDDQFCVTDGESYVWCYVDDDDEFVSFCRYGDNYAAGENILRPIANELQVDLLDEHDEDFFLDEDDI